MLKITYENLQNPKKLNEIEKKELLNKLKGNNIYLGKKDTTFIMKSSERGLNYSVYFDPDTNSIGYKYLQEDDEKAFLESNPCKTTIKSQLPNYVNKSWLPLRLYKGQYCVYLPNERQLSGKFIFRDELIVVGTMMGAVAGCYNSFKQIDPNTFEYSYTYWEKLNNVKFHLIDSLNQIALLEYSDGVDKGYSLWVSTKRIKDYPLIFFGSNYRIMEEKIKFDEPNYEQILQLKPKL